MSTESASSSHRCDVVANRSTTPTSTTTPTTSRSARAAPVARDTPVACVDDWSAATRDTSRVVIDTRRTVLVTQEGEGGCLCCPRAAAVSCATALMTDAAADRPPRTGPNVVVIGAGPAGLTAAYELGKRGRPPPYSR